MKLYFKFSDNKYKFLLKQLKCQRMIFQTRFFCVILCRSRMNPLKIHQNLKMVLLNFTYSTIYYIIKYIFYNFILTHWMYKYMCQQYFLVHHSRWISRLTVFSLKINYYFEKLLLIIYYHTFNKSNPVPSLFPPEMCNINKLPWLTL